MLVVNIFQLCLNNCFHFSFVFLALFSTLASLLLLRLQKKFTILWAFQHIFFFELMFVISITTFKSKFVDSLSTSALRFFRHNIPNYFFLHDNFLYNMFLNLSDHLSYNFLLNINRNLYNLLYSSGSSII